MEARDFRERYREFTALGAEVVGVSSDGEERHAAFAKSLDLPFPLLADHKSEIAKAFGVTRMGGLMPSKRVSFVIDAGSTIRRAISAELDIKAHTREALEAIQALD